MRFTLKRCLIVAVLLALSELVSVTSGFAEVAPVPLLSSGQPVDWWFSYKFSSSAFPSDDADPGRACLFGGQLRHDGFSQKYAVASSKNPALTDAPGLIGTSGADPLGATFDEIYGGNFYFVVWNDQFKGDPAQTGAKCDGTQCGLPWGHSKGMLAWNEAGDGVLLQVTTPSWPGSGSKTVGRHDGNTLGCISNDNDISNAQDFFALRVNRDDVKTLLKALAVASVWTDPANPQIVRRTVNGVPLAGDLDGLVAVLGRMATGKTFLNEKLSSGVQLIVKPSALNVPPWQFVSSILGGEPLLAATWWASPRINSTHTASDVHCWDPSLSTPSGEVDVAIEGKWDGVAISLKGSPYHAKVGVSLPTGHHHFAIFGDLNQQGQLGSFTDASQKVCASSQNDRGGLFFVIDNETLADSLSSLISGKIAPFPQ